MGPPTPALLIPYQAAKGSTFRETLRRGQVAVLFAATRCIAVVSLILCGPMAAARLRTMSTASPTECLRGAWMTRCAIQTCILCPSARLRRSDSFYVNSKTDGCSLSVTTKVSNVGGTTARPATSSRPRASCVRRVRCWVRHGTRVNFSHAGLTSRVLRNSAGHAQPL